MSEFSLPFLRLTRLVITGLVLLSTTSAWAAGGAPDGEVVGHYTHSDAVMLVMYVLLALVFSFMCSVAEAVLLSITPTYIAGLQESRPKLAAMLTKLKIDNVDRSLAAILTLIHLVLRTTVGGTKLLFIRDLDLDRVISLYVTIGIYATLVGLGVASLITLKRNRAKEP